jgi:hypothetical protein
MSGALTARRDAVAAACQSACCATVKVRPATVTVPIRALPLFVAILSLTEPLPVSLAPEFTVIQVVLLTAVHAQLPPVDTVTVRLPPSSSTSIRVGLIA